MTMMGALRLIAIGIAIVGVIDPRWTTTERPPVPVGIESDDSSKASEIRRELEKRLAGAITFESWNEPAAAVLVGERRVAAALARNVPVSTVTRTDAQSPNVRIVEAVDPPPVRMGWAATVEADIEASGLAGKMSVIVLEARGAELARISHSWTSDREHFKSSLHYTPPHEGASIVTVRAVPIDGEATDADNAVDLRLAVTGRRLKILVHEPRPSWNATFVRRALEEDPTFDVSTFVQASKGLAVRAGTPPAILTADALSGFDTVIIGAPEELRASEVDALRHFARRRGGAVVFVPDRRPAGRYLELMPSSRFDEVLVNEAVALDAPAGGRLRASEMAVYRTDTAGRATGIVLASVEQNRVARPVVVEWLNGEGRVLFSGALDAWRYRGETDEGFSRFWRARIAEAAQAAPARLAVSFTPGAPAVGDEVSIRARLRQTEFDLSAASTRLPTVRARVIDSAGHVNIVRLWPTSEAGTFAGHVRFGEAGKFDLQVGTDSGVVVDDTLDVAAVARHPAASGEGTADTLRLVADATGGVVVGSDLDPLARHLRGLSTGEVERVLHPWRSPWIVIAFVALLSTEWAMRRRRGYP